MTRAEIDDRIAELRGRSRVLDASDARVVAEQWEMVYLLLEKLEIICTELKGGDSKKRRWFCGAK